jgi:hypothetical protein
VDGTGSGTYPAMKSGFSCRVLIPKDNSGQLMMTGKWLKPSCHDETVANIFMK